MTFLKGMPEIKDQEKLKASQFQAFGSQGFTRFFVIAMLVQTWNHLLKLWCGQTKSQLTTSIREDWRRNNIENVSILSDEQRGIWFISFQRVRVRQFIQKERMIRSVEVITYI